MKHPRSALLVHVIGIVGLTTAVWHGTPGVPFHFDDLPTVRDNLEIRDVSNVRDFLKGFFQRGALKVGYALNYLVADKHPGGRPKPGAFHAVNLGIHIVNVLLAFTLIRALLIRGKGALSIGHATWAAAATSMVYAVMHRTRWP